MMRDLYIQFGSTGTLLVAGLIILTTITWFQALAGVVVSRMPSYLKAVSVAAISLVPPVSIAVVAVFLFTTPRANTPVHQRSSMRRLAVTPSTPTSLSATVRSQAAYAEVA